MGFVFKPIKKVVDKAVDIVEDVVDDVVDVIEDAADWVVDEIVDPVVDMGQDIIKYASDNPLETLAKMAAYATGNAWMIPLIDGASVAAKGGDLGDVVKASAISYAGAKVGGTVSKFVDPSIANAGLNSTVSAAISGGTKSAATALVYGQDPLKAFVTGGVNAGVGAFLGEIDTKLSNTIEGNLDASGNPIVSGWENLQDGVKDSITTSLSAELAGGNISANSIGSIVAKYTGVADTMTKFLSENTLLDATQAMQITSALTSAATTALAGNPEMSGEAFFNKFNEYGMEELKAMADKPVNKAIDSVTGASEKTQKAATALNEAMSGAANAAEGFNGVREELNGKIQEQERLKTVYNNAVDAHNANPSDTTANAANAASATYNEYVNTLNKDYNDTYKPQMDAYQKEYDKWSPQIADLETEYADQSQYLMQDIDTLNADMKPVYAGVTKAAALALRPGIDEVSYRELNNLEADDDIYAHYLANQKEVDNVIATSAVTEYNNRYKEGAITVTELPPATRFKGDKDPTIPYVGRGGDPANYGLTEKDIKKYNLKTGAKDAWYNLVQGTQEMAGYTVGGFGRFVDELAENIVDSFGVDLSEANNIAYQQYAIYNDSNLTSEEKNQAMAKSMENYAAAVDKAYAEDGADITFARDNFTDPMMNKLLADAEKTQREKISPEMQARQLNALPAPDTTWEQLTSGKAKDRLGRPYGSDPIATLMSGVQELPDFAVDLVLLALTKNPKFAAGLVMSSSSSEAFEANQQEIEGMLDSAFEFGQLQETPEFADLVRVYGGDEEAALAKLKDKSQVYSAQAGVVGGFGDLILAKVAGASGGASTLATVPTYLKPIITIGTGGLSEGITEAGEQGLVNEAIINANLADNVVTTGAAAFVQGVSTGAQSTATFEAVSKAVNIARSYTTFDETDESRATATAAALEAYKQRATVIDTLTEYGAFEGANNAIEVQERLAILGLDSKTAVEEIANDMFNNEVVTRAEVEAAVTAAEPEFNFTGDVAESIYEQFSGVRADSNLATEVAGYVDPLYTTYEEAKAIALAEGVTLTDEQARNNTGRDEDAVRDEIDRNNTSREEAEQFFIDYRYTPTEDELQQYTGAVPETEQQTIIGEYVDPRQTTDAEVRQFFDDQGYNPTDEEVAAMVGQGDATFETDTETSVSPYVDPRQTTEAEARQFFADQGYTPTDAEVAARVGQGNEDFQTTTETDTGEYVDPRQVTEEEARQFFVDTGYTPTDEEVAQFVAQAEESAQQTAIGEYVDPRFVDVDEVRAVAEEEGLTFAEAMADTYIGQKDEASTLAEARAEYDPLATTQEEAAAFFESTGYTADAQEIADFVASKSETVQESAIGAYVNPRQMTETEVRSFLEGIGYNATDEEVQQFIGQVNDDSYETTQESVIRDYTDPLYTDSAEVRAAYEELGLVDVTQEDVDRFVGQYTEEDQLAAVKEYIPTATFNSIKSVLGSPATEDDPNTADINEAKDATGIYKLVDDAEANGATRDEALQDAIDRIGSDLDITEEQLLTEIGVTKNELSNDINAVASDVAGLTGDVAGLGDDISNLEGNLAALGVDVDTVADLIGKPAREVTETDVDFVIDLIAQENVSAELTAQYDVTGDGIVDINDQNMLSDSLQGNDVAFADTSMFNPATGLYLQQEQDTQATMDAITDLNSTITTNINTQERRREIAEAEDMLNQMSAMQQVSVRTPDPMNIDYLYDFNSIFANPNQEGLFGSPYGTNRQPANIPMQPLNRASGFAEGGQVEDENDRLLRLLGDLK